MVADITLDFFTKNIDRTWRLLENLEAGMIGMNTGNSSAAETPFGGMKESGYGKESGKDVAINEYLVSFRLACHHSLAHTNNLAGYEDWYFDLERSLLIAFLCNLSSIARNGKCSLQCS